MTDAKNMEFLFYSEEIDKELDLREEVKDIVDWESYLKYRKKNIDPRFKEVRRWNLDSPPTP